MTKVLKDEMADTYYLGIYDLNNILLFFDIVDKQYIISLIEEWYMEQPPHCLFYGSLYQDIVENHKLHMRIKDEYYDIVEY